METNQHPVSDEFFAGLAPVVKEAVWAIMVDSPWEQVADVDWLEKLVHRFAMWLAHLVCACWVEWLEHKAKQLALDCPNCGGHRKCKRRPGDEMTVRILGCDAKVPKLYLECGRCGAPGISVTKMLTGLSSGSTSTQLELVAGFCAAQHSYAKASQEIEVHHGQSFDRTSVRRMALEVEAGAKLYAEQERKKATAELEHRKDGPERLMLQSDGGSVRTGVLKPCEPGDEGYGKETPTGRARRKREIHKRELITMDVREPGQAEPLALDVVVPIVAPPGQRSNRMLAAAARAGLADNTQVLGLGDLGSSLPQAFDEAFHGYDNLYSGDWKHACDYVDAATEVLDGAVDHQGWNKQMRDCIWNRDLVERDRLLHQAHMHRDPKLLAPEERCPVYAIDSYLRNNWDRMNAKQLKDQDLDFVSARAEAQVRDRTKDRYSGPATWHVDNLEGKAILRAIIAEGNWRSFRKWYVERNASRFERELRKRLQRAVAEQRLRIPNSRPSSEDLNPRRKAA